MLNQVTAEPRPDVLLVEDTDLTYSIKQRGELRPGQACQFSMVVNGHGALSFLEDAGPNAPQAVVVRLDVPEGNARSILDAMRTRPWRHLDQPVIYYACSAGARDGHTGSRVGYLVKTAIVSDMIETIQTILDLPPGQH